MFVSGKSQEQILRFVQSVIGPGAWRSRSGLINCLKNIEILRAGLRTPQMQKRINARFEVGHRVYGNAKPYAHAMRGVFSCGVCVTNGVDPVEALLIGRWPSSEKANGHQKSPGIGCRPRKNHPIVTVKESSLDAILVSMMNLAICDNGVRARCPLAKEPRNPQIEHLLQRIVSSEESGAVYRKQQAAAISAIPGSSALLRQIKQRLMEALIRERGAAETRNGFLQQLGDCASETGSFNNPDRYFDSLAADLLRWSSIDNRRKNLIARTFCERFGSHPLLFNAGRQSPQAIVTWYQVFPDVVWRVLHRNSGAQVVEVLPRVGRSETLEQSL